MKASELSRHIHEHIERYGDSDVSIMTTNLFVEIENTGMVEVVNESAAVLGHCFVLYPDRLLVQYEDTDEDITDEINDIGKEINET